MTSPILSIVTISFNQAAYLKHCLDSVLSQKHQGVEFIVVDPGSTDGSREILKAHCGGIDQLILEPDAGPADGLNKGFARANGKVGYFINSDDFLLPGAIGRILAFGDSHRDIDVAVCGAWVVDGDGQPLRRLRATLITPERLVDSRAIPVQQGVFFSMEAFRDVGGFNAENRSCWDTELLFNFAMAGKTFAIGHERIGAFRIYDGSLSGGVAGAAHRERLTHDWGRMRARLSPQQRPWPQNLARLARNLANPLNSAEALRMKLAPSSILRAWERDMQVAPLVSPGHDAP
ncbi:glycosyltransferase family 2 protein [Novosphingobium album (ex Liu et al. 2023)]|uniref:Glycosyltransferase family 2 protein n=1 Tax=Novosphingobium album (ex Liu et al. 2023) TaxID=3031130 RepID=A0ABT5WXM3_9SPHN|nr:glycosyltransferase family 2 protein [Novosphingobium album (ex Liu et al. 2023)]MDE8654634.1 glycosyltransferase family 2 protein [Novosphingobium album (ex Liu et al. 2023)]